MNLLLSHSTLLPALQTYLESALREFHLIPARRKEELGKLTEYVLGKVQNKTPVALTFVCTHNSRRSQLSQIWAQAIAYYFRIPEVRTYSGGTQATAFNPRAVKAIEKAGFMVKKTGAESNPVYLVRYSPEKAPIEAFSKVYDQGGNPVSHFGAVMTCTHADENCPFIHGAIRISLPYDDPKKFDGTLQEEARYEERCRQIARELLYAFNQVKG